MQYRIKVGQTEYNVETEQTADGEVRFKIGEQDYTVIPHRLGPHHILARIDGRNIHFSLQSQKDNTQVMIEGTTYTIQEPAKIPRKRQSSHDDSGDITPPMPGSVIRILVSLGDEVDKGQELLVMSAMKMETTLYAPAGGTIKGVLVSEGDQVAAGQQLFDFVPNPMTKEQDHQEAP